MPGKLLCKKPYWMGVLLKPSQKIPHVYKRSYSNIINTREGAYRPHCCCHNKFDIDNVSLMPVFIDNNFYKSTAAQQKNKKTSTILHLKQNNSTTEIHSLLAKESILLHPFIYKVDLYKPNLINFECSSLSSLQNSIHLPLKDENDLFLNKNDSIVKKLCAINNLKAELLISLCNEKSTSNDKG